MNGVLIKGNFNPETDTHERKTMKKDREKMATSLE